MYSLHPMLVDGSGRICAVDLPCHAAALKNLDLTNPRLRFEVRGASGGIVDAWGAPVPLERHFCP